MDAIELILIVRFYTQTETGDDIRSIRDSALPWRLSARRFTPFTARAVRTRFPSVPTARLYSRTTLVTKNALVRRGK